MMNEIKLKNGIMWNCMNNVVREFAEEDLNTNELLENTLGIFKKQDDGKRLSVYENQWTFCSTRGINHNVNLYYNTGSLDSNEITKYAIGVLASYELIVM